MYTGYWWESQKERGEDIGELIILRLILERQFVWTGLIWLRIGTSGRLL
jgi:hypothetical protein